MEVAMAIAVIAAGLFIALGVFFIICSLKSIKNSQENETRIKGLEDSLDNMEKLISERTSYLAEKLEESSAARVVEAQSDNSREGATGKKRDTSEKKDTIETVSSSEFDEISIEDLFDDDFEDWLTEESEDEPAPQEPEPEPIRTTPEPIRTTPTQEPEPTAPTAEPARLDSEPASVTAYPPSKHHMGYDVGKSGRKYTASELEDLIRA